MKAYIGQISPKLGDTDSNLKMMIDVADNAIDNDCDIVVFPELTLTGYLLKDIIFDVARRDVPNELLEKSKKIDIIFGMVKLEEDDYYYNTAYYLSQGKILGEHKQTLIASHYFKAHKNIEIINTRFGKIGILLGHEIYNQGLTYAMTQMGAKYIFSLVNGITVAGSTRESIGLKLKTMAKANSIANGVYTIVVNRAGIEDGKTFGGNSYLVSPKGTLLFEADYFKNEEMIWEIDDDMIRRTRSLDRWIKNQNTILVARKLLEL